MAKYDRLSDYKVDGVVESSKQGTFIGAVDTMPDASTAKGVTVLYVGADSTYESGVYYTSDGATWSVATVSQTFKDLASDVETLTGRVDGITSFEVEVVSALPATGVAGTIYFTPSTNSQTENVYDEFVYVSSGWEQVGSTTFTLSIAQASSGITINGTTLQSATASVTGLMTASQATELYDHEDRIQTLESDITLLSSSEEVENLAGRVTTLESTVNDSTTGLATKASQSDLDTLSTTVATNTSNISTNTTNISTNTTDISSLKSRMSTAESDIDSLESSVSTNASNISANTTNISTNTTDISSLKSRVSTAESDIDSLESSVSTLDGTVSTLSTTVAGKQDTVTGAATTIVSSNLTASRALASNSSGKVAVSSVTSTELGYLSGVTSNIQTQINTLTSGTFTVQVVDSLPSTGGDTTIYFVPNGSSGDNTHDEYMYVDGAWELIGSTAFSLDITQNSTGITINGTALQEASETTDGLMTSDMVNDIAQNTSDIDTLESNVTSLQGTVSTNASNISTLQSSVATNTSDISTLQSSVATNTSDISTLQSTVDSLGTGVASVTGTSPITASTTSGAVTVAHSTSGVGTSYASSYLGSTTAVPRLYIDSYGHITGVTTATIYPPTTAGTAGQIWRSDGSGQGQWATLSVADTSTASTSNAPLSISSSSTAITLTQGTVHSGGSVSSSTRMPTITVDSYGRVTSLGYNTVYPPTTAGTSGQYWKSDGSGQGVWTTADTTPTSGSTTLITSGAVYTAIADIEDTVSSLGTSSYTTSYGSCSSISSLYSILLAHIKSAEISLSFSFENSNGNDGTVFLTAPVYYSSSSTIRIGPGFYSIWNGSRDSVYTLYYLSCTSSAITVYYQGWSDSSTSSTTVSILNHCYYSYIG